MEETGLVFSALAVRKNLKFIRQRGERRRVNKVKFATACAHSARNECALTAGAFLARTYHTAKWKKANLQIQIERAL